MPRAFILTMGCPKNEADSDSFAGCLKSAGWQICSVPDDADLLIINTCAFIQPAVEESLEEMENAVAWKMERPGRRLVLAGCLPGRFSDDGSGGLEDFDLVIGPADTSALSDYLGRGDPGECYPYGRGCLRYLKISEGCSNNCAYCTIPSIRGPRRDRGLLEIRREVGKLAEQGALEIGIVGQDTAAWTGEGTGTGALLSMLAEEHPGIWFRLYYVHPSHPVRGFADIVSSHPNVMPYVDMPIQHASDSILERMGRRYTSFDLEALFNEFDSAGLSVRTTVITGYPGETDDDFLRLDEFLCRHSCIRTIAAFPWWPEEGTLEFGRYSTGEVPGSSTVQARLSRIGDIADLHYQEWGERLEGTEIKVLTHEDGLGHCPLDAPLVDGACCFEEAVSPCTVLDCRITGYFGPDLLVEPV